MPALMYAFCALPNVCKCCGAHAGSPHNANCLFNLPKHTHECMLQWRQGYKEQSDPTVATPVFDPQNPCSVSYRMGRKFAEARARVDRTTESLQQATAHAETVQSQGNY